LSLFEHAVGKSGQARAQLIVWGTTGGEEIQMKISSHIKNLFETETENWNAITNS